MTRKCASPTRPACGSAQFPSRITRTGAPGVAIECCSPYECGSTSSTAPRLRVARRRQSARRRPCFCFDRSVVGRCRRPRRPRKSGAPRWVLLRLASGRRAAPAGPSPSAQERQVFWRSRVVVGPPGESENRGSPSTIVGAPRDSAEAGLRSASADWPASSAPQWGFERVPSSWSEEPRAEWVLVFPPPCGRKLFFDVPDATLIQPT